ncbi:MAG TPA: T9SS type A sorting domain-containing protein, partial [Prolixibacteraceae bacterium]|nr:T9SS type A sorting domain-containing protein [Prolixibacteraceae bacterium]
ENGMYDAPGDDHAWRMDLDDVMGDTTLMFAHNTDFTDIMWNPALMVEFMNMTPHIGQAFTLYVVDMEDGMTVDSVKIDEQMSADFMIYSYALESGHSYYINFYADFNQNGMYDSPPIDHAWQLMLENVMKDTTLMFEHNTSFTDIFNTTSISDADQSQFRVYPNPAKEKVWIESSGFNDRELMISVYDMTGKLFDVEHRAFGSKIEMDVSHLKQGIYLVEFKTPDQRKMLKLIKE